jgi:hypothetical protein
MNEQIDSRIGELVRTAMARVTNGELKRDLWPEMSRKLREPTIRPSWFDWGLAAMLVLLLFVFPEAIPGLLYLL